ncbi:hypothetical protein WCLP8_3800010 [uncultured Gammaproteobacteria bacterium]
MGEGLVVAVAVGLATVAGMVAWRRRGVAVERRAAAQAVAERILLCAELTRLEGALAQERAALRASERSLAELRVALGLLPLPVWLRGIDGALVWCNAAFAKATDSPTPAAVIIGQRELTAGSRDLAARAVAAGQLRGETRHLVIDGARRMMEISEIPFTGEDGPHAIGFALDRGREEEVRAELTRHVKTYTLLLEQLGTAVAIFGPDRCLRFHNQAYARLWGFEESWLNSRPSFSEVLEELRTRRRLPEHVDFPLFRREWLDLFTSLIEPRETMEHLPDNTALRMLVVPHPFGGLMIVTEDVTASLALQSSYHSLETVHREVVRSLTEGVAVFGGDGRLKLFNPAFANLWALSVELLAASPHVTIVLDSARSRLDHGDDGAAWVALKEELVAAILDRSSRSGRLMCHDGSGIELTTVPLSDGAVLCLSQSVV